MDLLAGLTVGLTTVPQALAYAEVAGLPVQVNDFFVIFITLLSIFITLHPWCPTVCAHAFLAVVR